MKIYLFLFLTIGYFQQGHARQWWVYLTPEQAKEIYSSAEYQEIEQFATDAAQKGILHPIKAVSHNELWIHEMREKIEAASAVYFIRRQLHENEGQDTQTAQYLEFAKKCWFSLIQVGKQDHFLKNGGNEYWYEGDIALRQWLMGGFASYDCIRDDLDETDRERIDNWLRDFASVLWHHPSQAYEAREKNRGTSSFGICHVIALLLQDEALFENYFTALDVNEKKRGFQKALVKQDGIFVSFLKSDCENGLPNKPIYPVELSYRDGSHGMDTYAHYFATMLNITQAARSGGKVTWDLMNPRSADQDLFQEIRDVLFQIAYGDLGDDYERYLECLENPRWSSTDLRSLTSRSLAFVDARFDRVDWGPYRPLTDIARRGEIPWAARKLKMLRSRTIRRTSPSI